MKVYYLHFTEADFTKDGNIWTTSTVDLYDNDWYRNYSTIKSDYGSNLLGNKTWTGMDPGDGVVDGDRYIDYTGRIDITRKSFEITSLLGTADVTHTLNVYTTDIEDADFPDNWASRSDIADNRSIFWTAVYRYARFQLNFTSEQDISDAEVSLHVRIEIDEPVIAPLYRRTKAVLNKFPEWMKITQDGLDSTASTPATVGGQLINAVAGEWLDDLDKEVEYVRLQRYISTADTDQVAWVYYATSVPEFVDSVIGDSVDIGRSANLEEFYEADADADIMWWDENKKIIYVRKEYDELEINGEVYDLSPQHVWNWFDEHGAIVDLTRHFHESNEIFRGRILDVYRNAPGVSLNSFKLALRRELNLWFAFDGATPDSDYLGATPDVLELQDLETMDEYMGPDGMPTQRFLSLVEDLAERFPTTWGYFVWGKALWDIGGEENKGYRVLPYRYDATPVPDDYMQSGVGDGSDLYLYRPDIITGPREFDYRLKVRGRERITRTEYPEIIAHLEVRGRADKEIYDNPVQEPWFTIIVNTGTGFYYKSVQATVVSDVDNVTPTPTANSYYIYELQSQDGLTALEGDWYNQDGELMDSNLATPFYVDLSAATDLDVQWGRWDPDTLNFTDYPANGSVSLWLSDDLGPTYLVANASNTKLDIANQTTPPNIIIRSNEVDSAVGSWESEAIPFFDVNINGGLPANAEQAYVLTPPDILWDPNLEATPNKELVIEVVTFDPEGNRIVLSEDLQGNNLNLPYDILEIDGSNAWVDGEFVLPYSDDDIIITAGTSSDPEYPLEVSEWNLFEAYEEDTRFGVVDEVGPWRNGSPQEPGNANYILDQIDVDRTDFGLTDDEDIVITWMGVELVGSERVNVWLDTNTVNPATDDDNEIVYPDNAIIEEYSDTISNYVFSPFMVKARAITEIDPQWNPQIHSGWFYERAKEYYLYADPITETATATDWTLADVARQGAPIILKTDEATPKEYRQVAFFDEATPALVLENTEVVYGTGTDQLFIAYDDVFDIVITDLDTGETVVAVDDFTESNVIAVIGDTNKAHEYAVTYKLNNSFIADHDFVDEEFRNRTAIEIAERQAFGGDYTITYEGSDYDPATPIDLPLNTFYTTLDEGFIFLSHSEYDLYAVQVRLSPGKFVADGEDYMLVSLRSFDDNYNPKPNQTFEITATFGTFDTTDTDTITITTDNDGFATAILRSEESSLTLDAYLDIDGPGIVDATVNYRVEPTKPKTYRLVALPSAEQIPADEGESQVVVFGKVEDENYSPVPYAAVAWRRGRSVEEMFTESFMGQVIADDRGVFSIGPFDSASPSTPGYWFLAAESWNIGASPSGPMATPDYDATPYEDPTYGPIGDVVFWNEYPDNKFGVNDSNELPKQAIQMQVNPNEKVYYSNQNAYPVTYDDATPHDEATPVVFEYQSPDWYAIDRYTQYQLGLLGTGFYSVDLASLNDAPPDHKDV